MGKQLMRLSNQWASRQDHERYLDLETQLKDALEMELDLRRPVVQPRELQIGALPMLLAHPDGKQTEEEGGEIVVKMPNGQPLDLGYVAFAKTASMLGMHAGQFRSLPATITANALKYRLRKREEAGKALRLHVLPYRDPSTNALTSSPVGVEGNIVSTVGVDYGFVPNAEIIRQLIRMNERMGGMWKVPAASYAASDPKRATTLYMGTGDLFDCMVAEGQFLDGTGRPINVGFMVINSWLQTKQFELVLFTYDQICDNRIIWNYNQLAGFKRRHTKFAPEQIKAQLPDLLGNFSLSARSGETMRLMENRVKAAQAYDLQTEVKGSKVFITEPAQAIQWMTDAGYGQEAAKSAVQIFMQEEGGAPPRTLWDMVQAGSAGTRGMGDAEARFEKDSVVGDWLNKAPTLDPKVQIAMPSSNGIATPNRSIVYSR